MIIQYFKCLCDKHSCIDCLILWFTNSGIKAFHEFIQNLKKISFFLTGNPSLPAIFSYAKLKNESVLHTLSILCLILNNLARLGLLPSLEGRTLKLWELKWLPTDSQQEVQCWGVHPTPITRVLAHNGGWKTESPRLEKGGGDAWQCESHFIKAYMPEAWWHIP